MRALHRFLRAWWPSARDLDVGDAVVATVRGTVTHTSDGQVVVSFTHPTGVPGGHVAVPRAAVKLQ